jgi:hypothetical protein
VSCVGIDLNEVEIDIASRDPKNAGIEFIVGDITKAGDYPTGSFEVIVPYAVFGVLNDISLTEALRAAGS